MRTVMHTLLIISCLSLYTSGYSGEKTFVFNPQQREWTAYDEDGYRVAEGLANGGANYCPDLGTACHTPVGTFRIAHKGPINCVSSKFPIGKGGASMPYCMFFDKGFAIQRQFDET